MRKSTVKVAKLWLEERKGNKSKMLITSVANYIRKLQDNIHGCFMLTEKNFQLVDHLVLKEANVEAYCHHSW